MSHKSRRTETLHTKQQAAARTVSALTGKSASAKTSRAYTQTAAAEIASASSGAWVSLRLSKTDDEQIAREYVARGWVKSQADILQTLSAAQRNNLKRLLEKAHHDEPASAWANLPVTTAESH
jgi:hypothetical protein